MTYIVEIVNEPSEPAINALNKTALNLIYNDNIKQKNCLMKTLTHENAKYTADEHTQELD